MTNRRASVSMAPRPTAEAFALHDLRARLPRLGLRRLLLGLDALALLLVAATYLQLGPPELLFHGVFVVLIIDAFLFGRRVTYRRIAASSLAMLGYVLLPAVEHEIQPLELTEWPLMYAIAILVAWMADREQSALHRYATLYRRARERLVTAEERERKRLSRELHDGIGQTLTALTLALDAEGESIPENDASHARARALAAQALGEVRTVAERVRPPRFEARGLRSALTAMAESCGRPVLLELGTDRVDDLAPETMLELFRIAQEALSNAVRHAEANQITLRLGSRPTSLLLEVADDGRGFEPAAVRDDRLGLAGMRERAATVGAGLSIVTARGSGTSVRVELPRRP